MVNGIDQFRLHFEGYKDHYALIGGAACYIALKEAGLDFRATKDFDIVLCLETLDVEFIGAFWDFVKNGGYQNQQKSTGKKLFYRFYGPADHTFPYMLELFSRIPDALRIRDDAHLTPIPFHEEVSSLSAILMDGEYYNFIQEFRVEQDGVVIVSPECLIPLKAKAWLDLTERRDAGNKIDEKDIQKHKNDIFRLFQIISPDIRVATPYSIGNDLLRFFEAVKADPPPSLKPFGLGSTKLDEVINSLRLIFGLRNRME